MPVSKGRKTKPGAKAKAARQRQSRGERRVGQVIRQFGAVADLNDTDALNEVRDTVHGRVAALVSDLRHGKIEYFVVPSAEESTWRAALADAEDGTPEAKEAVDGLIEFLASDPKAALIVAQCRVYATQQRSKAHLS